MMENDCIRTNHTIITVTEQCEPPFCHYCLLPMLTIEDAPLFPFLRKSAGLVYIWLPKRN